MVHRLAPAAIPPGVDVDAVVADLSDDGVAAVGGPEPAAVVSAVQDVNSKHGLSLSVVVVDRNVGDQQSLSDLAQTLAARRQGTVLVLGPDGVGAYSDRYSTDNVTVAVQAAAGTPDDAAAVRAFADELTGSGPPWGWLVAGVVALTVLAAVAARWWERRRRRGKDRAALHVEGERLRAEVGAMADRIVRFEPQIPLHEDAALDTEFDQLSAGYQDLAEAVATDPADRASADALSVRVREATRRLDAVGVRLGDTE